MTETKVPLRPGPPTEAEAAKTLVDQLRGLSGQQKGDLKDLMFDRDLEELAPEQGLMLKRWMILNKISATDIIRFEGWMQSDDKFRIAVWKRRIARLEIHGMEVDDALAAKAKKGFERSMMIFYQVTGKMPVGGKMVEPPASDLSDLSDAQLTEREGDLDREISKLKGEMGKRKKPKKRG